MATKTKATSILAMKVGKPTKAEKAAAAKAPKPEPEKAEVKMPTWAKRRRLVAKLVKGIEYDLLCLAADSQDPSMKTLNNAHTVARQVIEMYRSLEVAKPWGMRARRKELEEFLGVNVELPAELVAAAEARAEELRPAREAELKARDAELKAKRKARRKAKKK